MTNSLTMFKLETMIYASEDGTNSVFTLNSALQKQLDALATQHPEVCQRKARGEAGGVTYQVRGAALAIQPCGAPICYGKIISNRLPYPCKSSLVCVNTKKRRL